MEDTCPENSCSAPVEETRRASMAMKGDSTQCNYSHKCLISEVRRGDRREGKRREIRGFGSILLKREEEEDCGYVVQILRGPVISSLLAECR